MVRLRTGVRFVCAAAPRSRSIRWQGLGKTFQVSAFVAGALGGGAVARVLVVAPTTLLPQWERRAAAAAAPAASQG